MRGRHAVMPTSVFVALRVEMFQARLPGTGLSVMPHGHAIRPYTDR